MNKKNILLIAGLFTAAVTIAQFNNPFNNNNQKGSAISKTINITEASYTNTSNSMAKTAIYYVLSFIKH